MDKPKIYLTQRVKGETYEAWKNRERLTQLRSWIQDKMSRGEWLPKEEYDRRRKK